MKRKFENFFELEKGELDQFSLLDWLSGISLILLLVSAIFLFSFWA